MNEAERREFICQLIDKVEMFEEEQENGQWLKSITFKLSIIPHDMKISLDNGSQIESVVGMRIFLFRKRTFLAGKSIIRFGKNCAYTLTLTGEGWLPPE